MPSYFRPYVFRAGIVGGLVGATLLLLSLIPLIGWQGLLLVWTVYVGAGALAVAWARQRGKKVTLQQGTIHGAVAGVVAGVIAHGSKWLFDLAITVLQIAAPNTAGTVLSGVVGGIMFGLIGVLIGIVAAGVLGAFGGFALSVIRW